MKKIVSSLLVLCMALALTACGGKEQTLVLRSEQEQNGLTMVDTMTLEAKGDKIQKMKEVIELDMSSFDETQQTTLVAVYDEMVNSYNSVDGVTATGEGGEGTYTINVEIDTTGDAVSKLAEQGLLQITGNADGALSLKATKEALTGSGYTVVE
ncbi:MAG: DUF1307 domain-containing protein [Lachnospiraceae bacterium]|nr:DUF1307 domain-containing protein [Lachnospiraceae bacterium]